MVTEAASLLGRAAAFPRGLGVASRPVLAAGSRRAQVAAFPRDRAVDYLLALEAVSRQDQGAVFPRDRAVGSLLALEAVSRQDLGAASQLVHVVDCPLDHARGLTRGEMGCCRFQRHRVRGMNEPGDEAWNDARLRESSDRGGKARVVQGGVS